MDEVLSYWQEPYPDPCGSMDNIDPYVESSDIKFDVYCSPLPTDPAGITSFVHPMPTNFLPFSDTSYTQSALYFSPGSMPANQRQQASQQLYINTQLNLNQADGPESSTASSSSFQLLQTPPLQLWSSSQPSVHIPSPQSALAENGMLRPDFKNMSPLPVTPLYSPTFKGEAPDTTPSPFSIEPDVVTQSPMPHILEWKKVIELCGTNDFIPQTVYQPYTEADRKRYIRDVELHKTIFFRSEDSSELGIYLDDALKQRLRHLEDKGDCMFIGCGPSVSIRIQWPGYPAWSKQIPTMDFKTPKGPITRAKLAKNIATCIRRFAESVQDKPMEADSDKRWKIGERHIRVEDLILVSLHHVSKGSWQPQLRFRRPSTPFPYHQDGFPPPACVL